MAIEKHASTRRHEVRLCEVSAGYAVANAGTHAKHEGRAQDLPKTSIVCQGYRYAAVYHTKGGVNADVFTDIREGSRGARGRKAEALYVPHDCR